VVWIAERLEGAGFRAWAVGGAVRDALAGAEPEDWDLATSARPGDVRRIFRRTVPIGIEHGTVGVIARSGRMYEVTTFRRDVETFGRRARVAFADTLEEDLDRRDFTINAVAWHPITREVRDPHGGMEDLRRGVLRTVGEPGHRFEEDRLRVLRALRFAGRFGLRVEERTWGAVRDSSKRLGHLSAERVREELMKVLSSPSRASASLRLYAESGVLGALYPELDACRGVPPGESPDLWEIQLRAIDAVPATRPLVRLAALFHRAGWAAAPDLDPAARAAAGGALAREVLRRLRASNLEVDTVTHLVAQAEPLPLPSAPDPELRRWIRRVGPAHLDDLFRLLIAGCRASGGDGESLLALRSRTRRLLRERSPLSVSDLPVGGADLARLGIPRGPLYGEILRDLLERVTDDPALNRAEILLEIVRKGLDAPEE
jgi:tRNA nucleotidyltransferase (CCA-adding enzyme)